MRPTLDMENINTAAKTVKKRLSDRSRIAKELGLKSQLLEIKQKRKILGSLIEEYARDIDQDAAIFVSMSHRVLMEHDVLIKEYAADAGFARRVTGFEDDPESEHYGQLRSEIIERISSANAFIGIWGDDLRASDGDNAGSLPGGWMPLELGIAMAMQKPFRLLLHRETLPKYISPVSESRQAVYGNMDSFRARMRESMESLYSQVTEGP